jgi:uncharacterized protein (UPF0332 family)
VKEHIGDLLEDARENLEAARVLKEQGFTRIAASRAYYAMFYAAEALLFNEGLQFSKHSAVHAAFGERFIKTGRMDARLHRHLLDAFRQRLVSDYAVGERVNDEEAQALIERAEEFLTAVEGFLAGE